MQGLTTPTPQPTTLRPEFVEWLKFQTFEDPELIKTATGCQEWATAFKSKAAPRWLSLIGMTGTGKTHCAKKLWAYAKSASDWSSYSYFPKMIFWPDFIQLLRAGDSFEMRQEMKRWPVLFLDDIGAERDPSGFAAEELNTLLGCRMDKWTLITSNKDIDGLHAIDRRIASRIVRPPNICVGIKSMDFGNRGNK
jgi:DNA replication protein DnaC